MVCIRPAEAEARDAHWAWLLPPLLLGVFLRLFRLSAQILGGDELNGVQRALEMSIAGALRTYHLADNCLPLTALYRGLLDLGFAPTEALFRAPSVLCGLLLLVLMPMAIARRLSTRIAVASAWLVALSPVLVLYARIARPYEALALAAFCAAGAFDLWWREGSRVAGGAFAVFSALAMYLHLGAAPFVVAPLLFAAWALVTGRRSSGRRMGEVVGLGLAVLVCCLLFLIPAWSSLRGLIAEKQDPLTLSLPTFLDLAQLQSGSAFGVGAALFWALALRGLVALWRRDRELARLSLWLVLGQVAGLMLLHPEMLQHPLVFDRYAIPALPCILLWAACGLLPANRDEPERADRRSVLAAGLAILLLAYASPFARPVYARTSFAGSNDLISFFAPPAQAAPGGVPAIYTHLRRGPLLEFPWNGFWAYGVPYYVYQAIHGQEVVMGFTAAEPKSERLRFRNLSAPTPDAFLSSRARFLVIHEDLPAETEALRAHAWPFIRDFSPKAAGQARAAARQMSQALKSMWGEPDFVDGDRIAWDLDRVRRSTGSLSSGAGSPGLAPR